MYKLMCDHHEKASEQQLTTIQLTWCMALSLFSFGYLVPIGLNWSIVLKILLVTKQSIKRPNMLYFICVMSANNIISPFYVTLLFLLGKRGDSTLA